MQPLQFSVPLDTPRYRQHPPGSNPVTCSLAPPPIKIGHETSRSGFVPPPISADHSGTSRRSAATTVRYSVEYAEANNLLLNIISGILRKHKSGIQFPHGPNAIVRISESKIAVFCTKSGTKKLYVVDLEKDIIRNPDAKTSFRQIYILKSECDQLKALSINVPQGYVPVFCDTLEDVFNSNLKVKQQQRAEFVKQQQRAELGFPPMASPKFDGETLSLALLKTSWLDDQLSCEIKPCLDGWHFCKRKPVESHGCNDHVISFEGTSENGPYKAVVLMDGSGSYNRDTPVAKVKKHLNNVGKALFQLYAERLRYNDLNAVQAHLSNVIQTPFNEGCKNGSFTICVSIVVGDTMHVFYQGDSPAFLIKSNGFVDPLTANQPLLHEVSHDFLFDSKGIGSPSYTLRGGSQPTLGVASRPIEPGDHLVMITDGVAGCFEGVGVESTIRSIKGQPPKPVPSLYRLPGNDVAGDIRNCFKISGSDPKRFTKAMLAINNAFGRIDPDDSTCVIIPVGT